MLKMAIKRLLTLYTIVKNLKKARISEGCIVYGNCSFEGNNYLANHVYFLNSEIGFSSYIGNDSKLNNVRIGRFCSISNYVNTIGGTHPNSSFVSTHPFFYSKDHVGMSVVNENRFDEIRLCTNGKTVTIGNDVWIGSRVTILGGITIGDGAIIAAGAVVAKDVLPYTIVGGVPAKILRYRFDEKIIERLLKIQWWNWDISKIVKSIDAFENINTFIKWCDYNEKDNKNQIC